MSFLLAVRAMRDAQKKYFKTRDRSDLIASKQLKAQVDKAIHEQEKQQQELIADERQHFAD